VLFGLAAGAAREPSAMKPLLYVDPALSRYGFPGGHPLGADRQGAFMKEAAAQELLKRAAAMPPAFACSTTSAW
jgi:hypothetical protein